MTTTAPVTVITTAPRSAMSPMVSHSVSSPGSSSAALASAAPVAVEFRSSTKPPIFKMGGNIDTFLSRLDNYFRLYPAVTDEAKIATLLAQLDESTYQVFQHANIPPGDRTTYDRFIPHVKERFGPKESEQEIRLNFRSLYQGAKQTFDEYYEALIRMAQKAFPRQAADVIDAQVRDQMIAGIHNQQVRIRLIEESPADSKSALT